MSTFDDVLQQVLVLLRHEGRLSYRALKRRFSIDDEYVEDLKAELIDAKRVALDEDGKVLVWIGQRENGEKDKRADGEDSPRSQVRGLESKEQERASTVLTPNFGRQALDAAAERRQLTVMFCDLVGSTALSEQLDPEELRDVVRLYQETCTTVIRRYDGYVAQHLGDGLLVYFGYPMAHEDEAVRAVHVGIEIIDALRESPLQHRQLPNPIQVRIGIHTGVVVIGEIGSSEKREMLALGETPNLAARVQGVAEPDTVVMSAVTQRLVHGLFECQDLGPQTLKGISTPVSVYRVIGESAAQSRFEVAVGVGLTPLVGREEELGLLQRRWTQAKEGAGQVVLLSGEAGIGKSRLVQALKEQVLAEGATRIEFRCSVYHRNSAFYPLIEHLQRLLQFTPQDTPHTKLDKLQQTLAQYRFPHTDTLALFAALLSLPQPEGVLSLTLSPQKQKQKTQEALVAWLLEEAERQTVYCAWEDLHWVDPSTLEVLTLLLDQAPTTRVLALLTFRPDFTPPWRPHSHITQLTLSRLQRPQVEAMVAQVTGGKALPAEVLQQIIGKTDGVPLFVEELTKMVLESELVREREDRYELTGTLPPLAIPSTLQDSLMARLDRLSTVREIVQLGATLGREFSYELLHLVSPLDEETLQQGLHQLVEAELIYQHGLLPQAKYLFKHTLIQDTAYQSLLKSKRQQYHQQIAQMLEKQFLDTKEVQPELVAHHYTEGGLTAQAIPYWQQAGQRARERSANVEAIAHLTKGLELLNTLPDTSERTQQELTLQLTLGPPLMITKGYSAPELERVYTRAQELSKQIGENPQLSFILYGAGVFYFGRGELHTAREICEQLLTLAQNTEDPFTLLMSRFAMSATLLRRGEFVEAREHADQGLSLYACYRSQPRAVQAHHCGVGCLNFSAWVLWGMGYPDQALKKAQEALTVAQTSALPSTLAEALSYAAWFHYTLGERQVAEERAAALVTLCSEQGYPLWQAEGTIVQGWVLTEQGRDEEGVTQIHQGLADYRATGAELILPGGLALLAAVYKKRGQTERGLEAVGEALVRIEKTEGRMWESELYRLKGELTLQSSVQRREPEAEACLLKAIEVARKQQAKSLELRAVMSLVRLRQYQTQDQTTRTTQHETRIRLAEAHNMLSDVYNWFTEGFDTKDLQEAKALLENLGSSV